MAAEDVLSNALLLQTSERRTLAELHAAAAAFPEVTKDSKPSCKPGPFARFGENACFERYESSAFVFNSRAVCHAPIQRICSIPGDPDVVAAVSSVQGICTWNWKTDSVISRRKVALRSLVTFEETRLGIAGMLVGCCNGAVMQGSVRVEDCHDDVVYAMDYCAEKRLLLTASADTTIKLWSHELESPEGWPDSRLLLRMTFTGHTSAVTCVLFTPDKEHFVSAGDDGDPTVRLWKIDEFDANDGDATMSDLRGLDCAQCAEKSEACARAQAAQHSSVAQEKFLLRGEAIDIKPRTISDTDFAANNSGKIRIFHRHGPGQVGPSHAGWINDVKLNDEGSLALSGSSDCFAKVWDVATGRGLSTILCDDWVMSVSFLEGDDSEESSIICTGLANSVITLWLWRENQPLRNFFGHSDAVMYCVAAKDDELGPVLHSCSYAGELSTWKLTTGPPLPMKPPTVAKISDDNVINVSWTLPVQNGAPVEGFRLKVRENELGDFHEIDPKSIKPKLNSLVFKCIIRPAIPGVSYQFVVAAKNRLGISEDSQPSVPRRAPPSVPASVAEPIIVSREGVPVVIWISPDSHGARLQHFFVDVRGGRFEDFGVHQIKVDVKDAARCATNIMAGELDEADRDFPMRFAMMERRARVLLQQEQPWAVGVKPLQPMALEVRALDPGTTYQFKVVAVNSVGKSEASPHSKSRATAPSVPDAPEEIKAQLAGGEVRLTWNEPKNNGEIILGYHIRVTNSVTCKAYQRLHASRTMLRKQANELLERACQLISAQHDLLQEKLDKEAMLLDGFVDNPHKRRLLIRSSRVVSRILLGNEVTVDNVDVDDDKVLEVC